MLNWSCFTTIWSFQTICESPTIRPCLLAAGELGQLMRVEHMARLGPKIQSLDDRPILVHFTLFCTVSRLVSQKNIYWALQWVPSAQCGAYKLPL